MNRYLLLLGSATLLFLSSGCDPKDPTPETQDFTCLQLTDEQGQSMGIHGSCTSSNDWGNIPLNTSELSFLNFSDTIGLDGTVTSPISGVSFAPNPVKIESAIHFYVIGSSSNPSLKVKFAIVDESLNIIQQNAIRLQGNSGFALYVDPAKFESGKYYRMYYRVSATGAPSLIAGYGNFLVCKTYIDGVNTTIESDCL